jgi:hypothetical protein
MIERAYACGNRKYYVHEAYGRFIVRRQDWLARTFVGYARDVPEALALIKRDAQSTRLRAA